MWREFDANETKFAAMPVAREHSLSIGFAGFFIDLPGCKSYTKFG
jgi:hypothetical protein